MDKHDKEALLDRVYELEGLLHLAITREDCPARLDDMIRLKGQRIAEIIAAGGERNLAEEPEYDLPLPESQPDAAPMLEEEEMMAEAREASDVAEAPVTPADKPAGTGADAEDAPVTTVEKAIAEATVFEEEEDAIERPVAPIEKPTGTGTAPLRSRFSLNDRFRFSRELFGGDTKRFDATVEKLNSFANPEDARDYIVTELKWDIEADDAAAEFVSVISD